MNDRIASWLGIILTVGLVKEWSDAWIKIGLSTEPADFDKATEAALRGYQLANLKNPMVVLRSCGGKNHGRAAFTCEAA